MRWEGELDDALRGLARTVEDVPPNPAGEERLLAAFDARWRDARTSPGETVSGLRMLGRPASWYLAAAASLVLVAGAWWTSAQFQEERRASAVQPLRTTNGAGPHAREPEATKTVVTAADPVRPEVPATKVARRPTVRSARLAAPPAPPAVSTDETGEFVSLPAADRLPRFESGMIVRVELPVSSLPAYGFPITPGGAPALVPADVLVGQDGQPRAIRLVSIQTGTRRTP